MRGVRQVRLLSSSMPPRYGRVYLVEPVSLRTWSRQHNSTSLPRKCRRRCFSPPLSLFSSWFGVSVFPHQVCTPHTPVTAPLIVGFVGGACRLANNSVSPPVQCSISSRQTTCWLRCRMTCTRVSSTAKAFHRMLPDMFAHSRICSHPLWLRC